MLPPALDSLVTELGKLPGIGPRTAERLAFYLLKANSFQSLELAKSLEELHERIKSCKICFNLSENEVCSICTNHQREKNTLAVVEEPLDIVAIEKTASYRGLYHVLGGVISPIDGVGPKQLHIEELLVRAKDGAVSEIILALNPSTEGEATAMYLQRQLPQGLKVTKLARGLPMGSDLEYADQVTLGRALEGRQAA